MRTSLSVYNEDVQMPSSEASLVTTGRLPISLYQSKTPSDIHKLTLPKYSTTSSLKSYKELGFKSEYMGKILGMDYPK